MQQQQQFATARKKQLPDRIALALPECALRENSRASLSLYPANDPRTDRKHTLHLHMEEAVLTQTNMPYTRRQFALAGIFLSTGREAQRQKQGRQGCRDSPRGCYRFFAVAPLGKPS